ncbi:Hypothetical protein CpCap5W_0977 [Corynebacterium pseudotuberculosis]|nr:Hypothetical protein CpPAT10_1687a [Corynebacterium pseudotuberculosis PAT10]AEX40183.1 Hypothetical protein Cp3995_1730 [Corynebacterium pseudotuberculosis 3/99-5]AFF22838.1 Hypothetical protein CpP54B96_1715 [Corynebacterium pseudotuberculosis P54B96]AFH52637.1 Hypothetical protein Cp267_1754 [Corynebacterium pseudotuberculosis 267]AJC14420.1 Hypothetical protein CpVD57_1720 [Corynebacterium pseudotuberculosis]
MLHTYGAWDIVAVPRGGFDVRIFDGGPCSVDVAPTLCD